MKSHVTKANVPWILISHNIFFSVLNTSIINSMTKIPNISCQLYIDWIIPHFQLLVTKGQIHLTLN